METKDLSSRSLDISQLKKYALDLAELYSSEKEKGRALEAAKHQLLKYADDLNKTIVDLRAAHRELQEAYLDTIHRLVLAAEYKDEDTGNHIVRMSRYCAVIAEKLPLPAPEVETILYAAPMHDIGKIGIPDTILMKPGKLTEQEFEIVKTHTTIGAKILADAKAEVLKVAAQIALSHHEQWNGRGYPHGLAHDDIPLVGRIVSLADAFDALTSKRPYKDPFPVERAIAIITKGRGEHFDPQVVDVFLGSHDEMVRVKDQVNATTSSTMSRHD